MQTKPHVSRSRAPQGLLAGACLALGLLGCSADEGPPGASSGGTSALPDSVSIADPEHPITRLEIVEDVTEEAADRLLTFSDKLRRRDFSAAAEFLTKDFAGRSMAGLKIAADDAQHLDVHEISHDVATSAIVGREGFLAGLKDLIGPWSRVESVIWKVKGAEFNKGRNSHGKIRLYIHMTGQEVDGGWSSISAWGWGRAVKQGGLWTLDRFDLDSLEIQRRAGTIFTDVSTSAGVAHTGVRFGKPGNVSYAFNGAAAGDVNGDGRWDIFLPSNGRNFLYMAQEDGTFREQGKSRGLEQPAEGTGAVFLDFDNDGDQDLFVGHVGWLEADGSLGGHALAYYENDGEGSFLNKSREIGLETLRLTAYSLTVLDYDQDGWLDLFVCGYGRLEVEHNNSWIEASNGAPNGLLRNLGGKRVQDVAGELKLQGNSWSYASAAADYDQDGDIDLYVANDYGPNQLYRNTGKGHFEEVAEQEGVRDMGNGMGVAWGDLNGDGLLDLYVSNMSSTAGNRILGRLNDELAPETHALLTKLAAGNSIFIARPEGGFERRHKSAGGLGGSWAWSPALCDLDLDGRLDVYLANGFVTGDQPFDT